MSLKALSHVFENSKSTGGARCVMLTIADITNQEGFGWAGLEKIAARSNMSQDNARLRIQDLQRLGELVVYDRHNKGYQMTCLYQVVLPGAEQKLPEIIGEFTKRSSKPKRERKRKALEPVQPVALEHVQAHGLEPVKAHGLEHVQPNPSIDPSMNHQQKIEEIGGVFVEEELPKRPDIYTVYEQNMGMLTPMLSESLELAVEEFGYEWVKEAIETSVKANVRRWAYAESILKRWRVSGRDSSAPKPAVPATPALPQPALYVPEKPAGAAPTEEEKEALKAASRAIRDAAKNGGAQ
jgi:DnaD/phage-associated family protein